MDENEERLESFPKPVARTAGLGDYDDYRYIRCSSCPYFAACPLNNSNSGCAMRKQIYDLEFSKIEFKTADSINLNRLRLSTRYYVDLMLMRRFGKELSSEEIMLYRTLNNEMSTLYSDKKGDMVDEKAKGAVPWEQSAELANLRKEVEDARSLREEFEKLKARLEAKERKESEAPHETHP